MEDHFKKSYSVDFLGSKAFYISKWNINMPTSECNIKKLTSLSVVFLGFMLDLKSLMVYALHLDRHVCFGQLGILLWLYYISSIWMTRAESFAQIVIPVKEVKHEESKWEQKT